MRAPGVATDSIDLRLTDPDLDFWVEVRVRGFDAAWLAVADLPGRPRSPRQTGWTWPCFQCLWPLGEDVARRMVDSFTTIERPQVVVDEP